MFTFASGWPVALSVAIPPIDAKPVPGAGIKTSSVCAEPEPSLATPLRTGVFGGPLVVDVQQADALAKIAARPTLPSSGITRRATAAIASPQNGHARAFAATCRRHPPQTTSCMPQDYQGVAYAGFVTRPS